MGSLTSKLRKSTPLKVALALGDFDWNTFLATANLDDLETFNAAVDKLRDALRESIAMKCKPLERLPPPAQAICDRTILDDNPAAKKQHIVETVKYVVSILPRAHISKRLKTNIRRILGTQGFTTNLGWAKQWDTFMRQNKQNLITLGEPLEAFYNQQRLFETLGNYNPPLVALSVPNNTLSPSANNNSTTATAVADEAQTTDSGTTRQVVPPQCSSDKFDEGDYLSNLERECVYIHFLRMVALGLNTAFQSAVERVLSNEGILHSFSSSDVKSYERMYAKMMSWNDHGQLPPPRPANNIDVVRCLVMFETPNDMRLAFDAIPQMFKGSVYNKFKNGMATSESEAAESYYLRLVLGTGQFVYDGRQTIGELRSDPQVQTLWRSYVARSAVPPFVTPKRWYKQARQALGWLQELSPDTPVFVHGEVQMVLRRYNEIRNRMHELYKVVRAPDEKALLQDFGRYASAFRATRRYQKDGNSELNVACRDGIVVALPRLLADVDAETLGGALEIAARYGHRQCVVELLSKAAKMGIVSVASDAPLALVALAKGDGRREPKPTFDADADEESWFDFETNERCAIAKLLLDYGVDVNKADEDGRTPVYWAAGRGYTKLVRFLISKTADVNLGATNGFCPSHAADNGDIVRLLCKAGADLNKAAVWGVSPLDFGACFGQLETVQALVECGANIHQTRDSGSSALLIAAQNGHAAVVRALLDADAQVDQRQNDGASPLTMACQNGHAEVARMLVDANADVNNVWRGRSAVTHARNSGHPAVAEVILARLKHKQTSNTV